MAAAPESHPPRPPREPEIELMGRVVRVALRVFRLVLWSAGLVAVGYGVWHTIVPAQPIVDAAEAPNAPTPASAMVWVCVGLPLLCPVDWLFGRGRLPATLLGAAFWFGAALLPGEQDYGFVIRFFATFVACSSLLVWRTVWRLTNPVRATNPV